MAHLIIRNGTLIDGRGGAPLAGATVVIEGNRIQAVGPESRTVLPAGDAEVIDAGGGFILPGFVDAHVHLMAEGFDVLKAATTPFSLNFYRAMAYMGRTLEAGVTTVRDAGGADLGVKRAVEEGIIPGPRMQISITALSITGGHGDSWMPCGSVFETIPEYPGCPSAICDGPEQVRRKVREVLRAGAEVIKVSVTGGVLSPTDHPMATQYSQEELRVMVEEGEFRRGIKVMAHAQGAPGIKQAVRAGIHSIEHGIYLDDEAMDLMLTKGTFLVPTLLAPKAVVEIGEKSGAMPEWGLRKAKESVDIHRETIGKAYRAGLKIAMGTDCAVSPHGTNLQELGLMCGIGMTPMEAIVASTRTGAECLGWQDRIGTLEPGKLADVVIVRTDPLADIRSLERADNIAVVVKDGRIAVDRRTP